MRGWLSRHPLISYDREGLGDDTRLMQELGVSFDEGLESVFGHVGDQIVEHAALAEQGMGLDGVGLEVMPRLSPAAPSRVSRTTANALSSSSLSRRCGSLMRTVERPKRRSLVSRKLGSTRHRFEYSAMICGAVASPLPVTRHQGSFMALACTHTTAPTAVLCSSRHQERLARYLRHEEHNPIFSGGYGLWPNRMSLPL